MAAPIKKENAEALRPLMGTTVSSYGSTALSEAPVQNPLQVDPVVLARTMQIIANQMASKQNPQPAPSPISQATAQQTLSLPGGQYVGDVKNGEPDGRGTLTFHPGMVYKKYEGEWKNGKAHGRGVLKFSNEDRLEGQWENGQLNGQGLQFLATGEKYEGSFVHGKRHGRGSRRSANGDTYVGDWQNNKVHGRGTMRFANGDIYEGEWEENKSHGEGKFTWNNGDYYSGEFVNGKPHGQGALKKNGTSAQGIFRNDRIWTGTCYSTTGHKSTVVDGVASTNLCDVCSIL